MRGLPRFIALRLIHLIPVVLGVTFLVFTMLKLVPGDPATAILGIRATPEAVANIREAIELVVEDLKARGEEIPDPSGVLVGSVVITR